MYWEEDALAGGEHGEWEQQSEREWPLAICVGILLDLQRSGVSVSKGPRGSFDEQYNFSKYKQDWVQSVSQ